MSSPSKKRLPGQSNAEYARRPDPNAGFLGTQSLSGGDWFSGIARLIRALIVRKGR